MMRVTKDNIDLLVANVKGREYLEREMGLRTALGISEPVVKVDSVKKLAEVAAVTGRSMERNTTAKRVRYGGVVFQSFEVEQPKKYEGRLPWV